MDSAEVSLEKRELPQIEASSVADGARGVIKTSG
jgi:hypothetical protein